MVQINTDRLQQQLEDPAAKLASSYSVLNRLRTASEQMQGLQTCIRTLRYAGRPLPIRVGGETFDFVQGLLIERIASMQKRIREEEAALIQADS